MKRLISFGIWLSILSACAEPSAPNASAVSPGAAAVGLALGRTPSIQIVDLGTLPGAWPSFANALNANRVIAGYSYTGANYSGVQHAVRWQESTPGNGIWGITDLSGQITGSTMSAASAVNAGGAVAGWMRTSDGVDHAFVLSSGGSLTVIAPPAGKTIGYATDINASGEVVGSATVSPDPSGTNRRAFYYASGTTVELPTLSGASEANSIADNGTIVGYSRDASGTQTAVEWTRDAYGTWTIAALAGSANSTATAINTTGSIAGSGCPNLTIYGCSPGSRAYFWSNATTLPTVLGTLGGNVSAAYGIDDSGNIAGWSTTKVGRQHAFYLASGSSTLTDLGSLAGSSGSSGGAAVEGKLVAGSSSLSGGGFYSVTHATLWILP
jgi:probable HAF family extracellular repeat protein